MVIIPSNCTDGQIISDWCCELIFHATSNHKNISHKQSPAERAVEFAEPQFFLFTLLKKILFHLFISEKIYYEFISFTGIIIMTKIDLINFLK